jgi:tRNA-specific 2-thiouridylase
VYVDAASGQVLGRCANTLAVTIGQKAAGLGGQASRVYVVGKNLTAGVVHVVAGHDHPALFSSSVLLTSPSWVAGRPPAALPRGVAGQQQAGTLQLQCNYQARYRQAAEPCSVQALQPGAAPFVSSRFCQASAAAAAAVGGDGSDLLVATLPQPLRGVAPGQMFVMYDGPVCLGSAVIAAHGPTLHEQPQQQDERAAAG